MDKPLISVIVPVYNVERFLSSCLDSILSQSYHNIEIIVINDGSTDFSLKIAEQYAANDDRIRIFSQDNKGQSVARNHGLNVATGEFISFVDADDMLMPKALEAMISIQQKYEADIVEGKFVFGREIKAKYKDVVTTKIFTPERAIENVLYQSELLPSSCGKIYKTDLFAGLRFCEGVIYEDLDIFYKVFERANKIASIDFPVYFYRENEESTIHKWQKKRLDVLKVTQELEEYITKKYPDLLPAAKDRRLSANFNMFALCSLNGEKDQAYNCWRYIKDNRVSSLFDPKVRLKNKAGILLSYLGSPLFRLISGKIYK